MANLVYSKLLITALFVLGTVPSAAFSAGNDAPQFNPVADQSIGEGATLSFDVSAVDPQGDQFEITLVSAPSGGLSPALILNNEDGSVTFVWTPDYTQSGTYLAKFKTDDGQDTLTKSVEIVVLNVNLAPVAFADEYPTNEDTLLSVPADGVRTNDNDPDGNDFTAVLVAGPSHAAVDDDGFPLFTLNADGSFTYLPEKDYNGPDSFTYKATDGDLESEETTVTIDVVSVNDAPVAKDKNTVPIDEDTVLNAAAPGALEGDTDVENNKLTAVLVDNVQNGVLVLNTDGFFTYTPAENWSGQDSFTYKANDGQLLNSDSNVATITIGVTPVEDVPIAGANAYSGNEDIVISVAAPGVLVDDTDAEKDPLSAVVDTKPLHGALVLNADGSFDYTPDGNWSGTDTFTYKATELANKKAPQVVGGGAVLESIPATVTIKINAVNDAPQASPDSYTVDEDNGLSPVAPGLLVNDDDAENDALTAILITNVTNGELDFKSDGLFNYVPNANWNGVDSFTYKLNDGLLDSNTVTVDITVNAANDAPVFDNISNKSIDEGNLLSFEINASDADIGDTLAYAMEAGGPEGITFDAVKRTFSWTPSSSQSGNYVINFSVKDGNNTIDLLDLGVSVGDVPTTDELKSNSGGGGGSSGVSPAQDRGTKAPAKQEGSAQQPEAPASGESGAGTEAGITGQEGTATGQENANLDAPSGLTGFAVLMNAATPGTVVAGISVLGLLVFGVFLLRRKR